MNRRIHDLLSVLYMEREMILDDLRVAPDRKRGYVRLVRCVRQIQELKQCLEVKVYAAN
jgi:hypothetical protein